jgi:general secretion pathway protein D
LKAIAKALVVCVIWATAQSHWVVAGTDLVVQGAGAAMWSVAQQDAGSDDQRRQAADQWLKRARQAVKDGNLELADDYVGRAEKLNAKYDSFLSRFSDTPTKVRRDIAEAKSANKAAVPPSQRIAPSRPSSEAPANVVAGSRPANPDASRTVQTLTDDTTARSRRFLENGRNALKNGEINEAIAWRQKAVTAGATFAPGEYSPADLARELQQAGVDPNRLSVAPTTLTPQSFSSSDGLPAALERLPATNGASVPGQFAGPNQNPSTGTTTIKDESVRLAARARVALDKGDLASAQQLAKQAESLGVPDSAYVSGDIRPWEVLLQVESALNRNRGVAPAAHFDTVPTGSGAVGGAFPVSRGLYDGNRDTTRNAYAQNQIPTPAAEPPAELAAPQDSVGVRHFEEGMSALNAGDREKALAAFREAWKYQQELPPAIRQQVKDKLFSLPQAANAPRRMEGEPTPLEEVNSQQQLAYQKLYREIAVEETAAEKMTTTDPKGALQRMNALRDRVNQSELDPGAKKQLLTFVDRGIGRLQNYIEQNKGDIELNERNRRLLNEIEEGRLHKFEVDDTIASKVDEFNKLMEEERFPEAEVVARQVRELAPDNPISRTLLLNSTLRRRHAQQAEIKDLKEQSNYDVLTGVELASFSPLDQDQNMTFGDLRSWETLSKGRLQRLRDQERRLSPTETQIREALKKPVEVRFENRPLKEVLETLGSMSGVNIYPDSAGLASEGVTSDTPVSINLTQPISLESALNLILQPLRLGHVIRNEVLHVTSEQVKDSNVFQKTYYVADLVVPIPNFVPTYNVGLPAAIREAHQAIGYGASYQPGMAGPMGFAQNDAANISSSVLAQQASNYTMGPKLGRPVTQNGVFPGSMGGAALADFDSLIDLITATISPTSWDLNGGQGAIESFATNLSLVISQTQDIHDQIADLLEQLRRLQDLQVAIEVRFITLQDDFFERIGIDFDFDIDDNVRQLRRDDDGPSMSIGLGDDGLPTADFDFPFNQGSLNVTTPPFAGTQVASGATFGMAILSDIEAFFIVRAATGNERSNVLTAPKVTLFNGQAASVADTSQRPFVIGLIPVVGDFAVAHQPVVTVLNEGTQLGVQAVVSSDRRFVRLTLVPFFSQIGDVDEFTFNGATTTDSGTNVVDPNGDPTGDVDNEQASRVGTTIQLPTFSFTTVSTTVSVPDGGTILLGGIKRLREGRNEFGVPGLNKIPYVNRLFKNVGIGRETQSLMLMVTPRIIIQEEEELKLGLGEQ